MAIASIVIGIPIDEAYLRRMPEYKNKIITQADKAKVAAERPNDEGKETMCKETLEGLAKEAKAEKSTMCMVYNATGADLTYVLQHDWCGQNYESPYPILINNGQWGAWLHASFPGVMEPGSSGAVIYRGKSQSDKPIDWLQSWEIQEKLGYNMVYTEVRKAEHYVIPPDWSYLRSKLTPTESVFDDCDGCSSVATIGADANPALFTAIMSSFPLVQK